MKRREEEVGTRVWYGDGGGMGGKSVSRGEVGKKQTDLESRV